MTNQIITQDIGNGYFLHQLNIQTRTLKQTIAAPISLSKSRAKNNSIIKSQYPVGQDISKFQSNKFHEYVAQNDWVNNKGKLVKFVFIQNGKIAVNPAAINQFNKYPNHQISFIGNYGRKDAGKSFWYDKILNLSGFEGNYYSSNPDKQPGLYFWNIPFTKGDLKFFMIDYVGYKTNDVLSEAQKKLLDFQLLISQKFIVVPQPNDDKLEILKPSYNHLIQSKQRFSNKNIKVQKFTPYWPNEIYTLYRTTNPVRKQIDNIGILFETYNFSIIHNALKNRGLDKKELLKTDLHSNVNLDIINPKYVKMTSLVFKDIYDHMNGKQYGSIKANGKNIGFLIDQSLNNINNGSIRKMDEMLLSVKGDIYDDAVAKSKEIYLNKINYIIIDQKPRSIDELTNAFDKANKAAYQEFDKHMTDPKKHDQYQKKLENEINRIEQKILQQNKLKTYQYYKNKIPINTVLNQNDLQKLKASFVKEKHQTSFDHDDTMILEEKLANNITVVDQNGEEIFLPNSIKKRQNQLRRLLQNKKRQLQFTMQSPNSLKGASVQLIPSSQSTIQFNKNRQKLNPDEFQLVLSVLRDQHKQNDLEITKLKGKTYKHPQAQQIKEKLYQVNAKNSKIEQGLSSIDKSGLSLRPKSIIRQIKQDSKIRKVVKK